MRGHAAASRPVAARPGKELARAVGGETGARSAPAGQREEHHVPKRACLTSISVEGFRDIGQRTELPLNPGPGLVLVTGRNGSGKSSLAEAFAATFRALNAGVHEPYGGDLKQLVKDTEKLANALRR